jgi:enoyl-CoA hydratase/carnithine racemase
MRGMDYEQIAYDVADRILTITLDRPDALNAFTPTMMLEMLDAFDRADADESIRAIVVTGRGRGFCAGADLSAGGSTFDATSAARQGAVEATRGPGDVPRDGGGRVTLRIFNCTKPVIAAINGPAVGIGITMTLPMDIRLASETAKMGFVFARRGLVPEACSSWFLPRLVGMSQATEWVYTGRVFPAADALAAGLVRSLHAPEDLLPAAYALAHEIADNTSAVSIRLSRQLLWQMQGAAHPMEAHRADSRAIFTLGQMADVREGVMSFLEKRPPRFTLSATEDTPDIFPGRADPEFF